MSASNISNPVATPTATTTYTVTVSGSSQTATSSVVITVNPLPLANAGTDKTICSGASTTLTATGGGTYAWNVGGSSATTTSLSPTATTTYTVTVTSSGCSASDAAIVNVINIPTVNAGLDATICQGLTRDLIASGTNVTTYSWSTQQSGANITVTPTTTTSYAVTATNTCGTASDNVVVIVNPLPTVNAGTDAAICIGQAANLTASGTNVTTYNWAGQPAGASYIATPSATTTYSVTGTNSCGTASDNVVVSIIPTPTVNAGNDATVCTGQSVNLLASGSDVATYNWAGQPAGASYTVTPSSTTTYTVSGTNSCGSASDNVVITVSTVATVNAGNDVTICSNESAILTAAGGANTTYLWSNQQSGASITVNPTSTTTYTVAASSTCGTASDNVVVTVNTVPTSTFTVNPTTVAQGVPTTITYAGNATSGASYNWNFNGGNIISGSGQGPYSVSWTNVNAYNVTLSVTENNCTSSVTTKSVDVTVNIGSSDNKNSLFSLYPNPAKSELTVELNGTYSNNSTIVVYNMIGEAVMKANVNSSKHVLDLNNLSNGTYYISVNNGEKTVKDKFIIIK
ncbi:MAG: T9SS type A sorting domain-containing protein [Bacteroidota bacterium]